MLTFYNYAISFLSIKAVSNVIVSIYSISVPTGIPVAILDILTSVPSSSFLIYCIVVSPSIEGLRTTITSLTLFSFTLSIRDFILISLGPIPSKGDIKPFKT